LRVALGDFVVNGVDDILTVGESFQDFFARLSVGYGDFFALFLYQLGGKRRWRVSVQVGGDRPVLLGFKDLNRAFSFTDDAQRYGLHSAGAEAALDLAPQKRRDVVSDQPVEYPAGLLGFVFMGIEILRCCDRLPDGIFGEFMKENPIKLAPLFLEDFCGVPGDGLAFAVGVRGQIDISDVPGRLLQPPDDALFAGNTVVIGFEAVFDVDPHFPCRKVFEMPDGCGDVEVLAEIFFKGFDFCRRFDDEQGLGHCCSSQEEKGLIKRF
jgi:hypothetical protein